MSESEKSNRIVWIDCAKGIAICLVVIGHSLARSDDFATDDIVRGIIFSKTVIKLLIPLVCVYGLIRLYYLFAFGLGDVSWKEFLRELINILVYSSGVDVANLGVPALGMLWFLAALFCSKNMFDYLHYKLGDKKVIPACITLCLIGTFFGIVQWLPLSFDIALTALLFVLAGFLFRGFEIGERPVVRFIAVTLIWLGMHTVIYLNSGHYLELATREYPLMPVCFLCSMFGILSISYFSYFISKVRAFTFALSFLGRNTMTIYCVHAADRILNGAWAVTEYSGVNAMIRLFIVLCVACVIVLLKKWIVMASSKRKIRKNAE